MMITCVNSNAQIIFIHFCSRFLKKGEEREEKRIKINLK